MDQTVLFSFLFLAVGGIAGWMAAEKYIAFILASQEPPHEFQELFDKNPHPELFDAEGNLDTGEYFVINFPPNFDPEEDGWYVEDPDEEDQY